MNKHFESNDFFNPFMIGLSLWQSYFQFCMDLYNQFVNSASRTTKDCKDMVGNNWMGYIQSGESKVR